MSEFPEPISEASFVSGSKEFANPKLRAITIFAQARNTWSLLKGIAFEILSWVFALIGYILLPVLSIFFSVFFFSLCIEIALFLHIEKSIIAVVIAHLLRFLILLIISVICYLIFINSFFYFNRLAKMNRINAQGNLVKDKRDPVLYLRSFYIDTNKNAARRSRKTHEEILCLVLNDIGPIITIGKPDETRPLLGANRVYIETENWEDKVKQLMEISQLIIIHAGTSKSLIWEIEAATEYINPSKILISFSAWEFVDKHTRQFYYDQFKKNVESYFQQKKPDFSLPDTIGTAKFLVFEPNWSYRFVELSTWKKLLFKFSSTMELRETLRPVLKERNLKLKWWRTILFFCFILWFIIGAITPFIMLVITHDFYIFSDSISFSIAPAFLVISIVKYYRVILRERERDFRYSPLSQNN